MPDVLELFPASLCESGASGGLVTVARGQLSGRLGPLLALLPEWVPTPGRLRHRRAVRRLDAIADRMIERRRTAVERPDDLLGLLLRAREEGGNGMGDRQVRDEVLTFLLAGHDTTALLLAWSWYLLVEHPDAEGALLAELRAALGDRPPVVADLARLRGAESVLLEALRLYPPSWLLARTALRDFELGGYRLRAGTIVLMSQWVLHRDPRYYDRPDEFDPGRWADGLARRLPRGAYFPFGIGPRTCIGNTFALTDATLLLAMIAPRFRFELVPGQAVVPRPDIVLRPAGGIRAVLRRR